MDARSRRKIQMGTSALDFSRPRPDSDAGYTLALAKLELLVGRAGALATAQRDGLVDVRAAAQTDREVLVKHGLAESVLEQFGRMLEQFDAAVVLGTTGGPRTRAPPASFNPWPRRSCRRCG
jgi:hypothetical protein